MKALAAIARELIGLFIEDGSLALAIAGVVVAAAIATSLGAPMTGGIVLSAGCIGVLAENVLRARPRR